MKGIPSQSNRNASTEFKRLAPFSPFRTSVLLLPISCSFFSDLFLSFIHLFILYLFSNKYCDYNFSIMRSFFSFFLFSFIFCSLGFSIFRGMISLNKNFQEVHGSCIRADVRSTWCISFQKKRKEYCIEI